MYDDYSKLWLNDGCLKNITIDNIDLLSIDVFDTLLFRMFKKPDSLFEELGKKCVKMGLFDNNYDPKIFRHARIYAERSCSKKGAALDDIYQLMPAFEEKQAIMCLELELEKERSYINLSVMSLICYAHSLNIPVILTSDMYLSKKQIIDMLTFHNFDLSLITDILVSSELLYFKYNGTMYDYICEKYNNMESDRILHIGDNFISDYLQARIHNLNSIHYDVVPDKLFDKFHIEEIYHGKRILPQLLSVRKLACNLNRYAGTAQEQWFEIGASIIGPFLALVCEHISEFCIEHHVRNLYPIMREGALFEELLKIIFNNKKEHINIKPLYASRRSTFLAGLSGETSDILRKMKSLRNFKSVILLLGLDISDNEISDLSELTMKEVFSSTRLLRKIVSYFSKGEVKEKIAENSRIQQNKLSDYLEGFDFKDIYAFLDFGYKGTSMYAISNVLNHKYESLPRSYNILAISDAQSILEAGNKADNIVNFCEATNRKYVLIENFLIGNEKSTIDYYYSQNKIYPLLEDNDISETQEKGTLICQEGVKLFLHLYLSIHASARKRILDERDTVEKIFDRIENIPTNTEAKILNSIVNEDFGQHYHVTNYKCDKEHFLGYPNFNFILKRLDKDHINCFKLLKKAEATGIKKFFLYGANSLTITLLHLFSKMNLEIEAIVETKKQLIGLCIKNIPVISIDEVINNHSDRTLIIITEKAVENIIVDSLVEELEQRSIKYLVLKLDGSEF